ncbi:MAG: Na+/H+-dicarboxylate symporter [Candidatus Midichloriaceae bacterium]
MQNILVFVLPALIISSIYRAIVGMRNYSILLFPGIVLFICGSNFLHVFGSANLANILIDADIGFNNAKASASLSNLFSFHIPKFITNEQALYIGFVLGFIGYKKSFMPIEKFVFFITKISDFVLKKIFIPMLPLFIFGMSLKMINDGVFEILVENASLFGTMFAVLICYLTLLLLIASGFSITRGYKIILNIIPAVLTALSSMSSTIALPFSIKAAHKNTTNNGVSDFFMPATVNIHMIGDCIIIPFLTVIVLNIFGFSMAVEKMPLFAFLFMITKFSGAGIPGGTVFIMVPLMVKIFDFTPQMSLLITSMYIVIDPFATATSVMVNNLFVIILDKILIAFGKDALQKK